MIRLLFLLGALLCCGPLSAQTQFMQDKIAAANSSLERTENAITKDRVKLGDELRRLESDVLALREKTAVARRQEDERTLGLSKLEARLAQWKEQQRYQQNLLDRFLQQNGVDYGELTSMNAQEKMRQAGTVAAQLARPSAFSREQLVLGNGEFVDANTLSVGPVTWFIHGEQVGLAENKKGRLSAIGLLPGGDLSENIKTLSQKSSGMLTLDPTMGRAMTQQKSSESIIEHVTKGGIWVLPILLFALVATVIGLLKVFQLFRLPSVVPVSSSHTLEKMCLAGEAALANIRGMQRRLLTIAQQSQSSRQRDDQLFVQLQQDRHRLDKGINAVAVTAAVAPLLGLLGTVSGMIETFRMMTAFGSSDPEVISGGIAKALVTTELGLVVAIPALILNALLSRKARHYYTELENFALLLSGDEPQEQPALNPDNRSVTEVTGVQSQTT